VNVASRLEGINKIYGTRICISHSVFREAGDRLCVRPIDEVLVKGRRSKIPIYELMGVYGAGAELEPDAAALRLCELTQLAYEALVQENSALARTLYKKVLDEFPEDTVALEIARRLAAAESTRRIHRQASD
jgi:adenylate cyclase